MCYSKKTETMKQLLSLTFCLVGFTLFGQNNIEQLKMISTSEQVKKFIETNSLLEPQIITITPEVESKEIAEKFKDKKVGDIFSEENFTFKILEIKKITAFRVSYIFLDGSVLDLKAINKSRNEILNKYKKGESFTSLAKQYTMDSSQDGDLGWFTESMMVKDFVDGIKKHKQNDIFTIDIPSENWYYVTLKTFKEKMVEELKILRIKSNT